MRSGVLGLSVGDSSGAGLHCEQTLPCNGLSRMTTFCYRSQGRESPRGPCSAGGNSRGQRKQTLVVRESLPPWVLAQEKDLWPRENSPRAFSAV